MILLGAVLIYGGITEKAAFEKLPSEPEVINSSQLKNVLSQEKARHITLQADLELTKNIYYTGLKAPAYIKKSPLEVTPLKPEDISNHKKMKELLGSFVSFNTGLNLFSLISIQSGYEKEDSTQSGAKQMDVMNENIICPLKNTNDCLWALSPSFHKRQQSKKEMWKSRGIYTGRLVRFQDININRKLKKTHTEIYDFYKQNMKGPMSYYSYVILTDTAPLKKEASDIVYSYIPVKDTGNSLFAHVNRDREGKISSGTVTGIVKPENSSAYSDFATLTGKALPGRIGFLSVQTAEEYNSKKVNDLDTVLTIGIWMLGLGLFWLFVRLLFRLRKKHKQAEAEWDRENIPNAEN